MAAWMCVIVHDPSSTSSFIRLGRLIRYSHRWQRHTDSVMTVYGICLRYVYTCVCVCKRERQRILLKFRRSVWVNISNRHSETSFWNEKKSRLPDSILLKLEETQAHTVIKASMYNTFIFRLWKCHFERQKGCQRSNLSTDTDTKGSENGALFS